MPRTARVAPTEHVYHVLTRGNNRQDVFEDGNDFREYPDLLLRYKEKCHFKLYRYVMMTNHVHYSGNDFVKDMTTTYNISEKTKRMGRPSGWMKNKENRPL